MTKVRQLTVAATLIIGVSSLLLPPSASAAVAAPSAVQRVFQVGKRSFEGSPKTICVIEGKWTDGGAFSYEAWDTCKAMTVSAPSLAAYKGWAPRGPKGAPTVADIPPGSEVIEIGNGYSSVLVYRDRRGDMQEVLIRD